MSKGFAEFVEGKRIALIGGAKDANEERAAEADIVARCNLYIGEGQRCDMAFLAGDAPDTPPAGLRVACVNIRSNRCLESVRRWPGLSALKVFGFYNAVYAGVSPHGHDQEWLNLLGISSDRCRSVESWRRGGSRFVIFGACTLLGSTSISAIRTRLRLPRAGKGFGSEGRMSWGRS